jgi:hypothetical protein
MKRIATGVVSGVIAALTATAAVAQNYDPACQQYASQQAAAAQAQANNEAVGSTLLGAAVGAGIGAAVGGGRGAAIGAGTGAIVGSGTGMANAQDAGNQAYWSYYNQCMASRTPAPAPQGYPPATTTQQLNQQQMNQYGQQPYQQQPQQPYYNR